MPSQAIIPNHMFSVRGAPYCKKSKSQQRLHPLGNQALAGSATSIPLPPDDPPPLQHVVATATAQATVSLHSPNRLCLRPSKSDSVYTPCMECQNDKTFIQLRTGIGACNRTIICTTCAQCHLGMYCFAMQVVSIAPPWIGGRGSSVMYDRAGLQTDLRPESGRCTCAAQGRKRRRDVSKLTVAQIIIRMVWMEGSLTVQAVAVRPIDISGLMRDQLELVKRNLNTRFATPSLPRYLHKRGTWQYLSIHAT
jgi:hypothetical protein